MQEPAIAIIWGMLRGYSVLWQLEKHKTSLR